MPNTPIAVNIVVLNGEKYIRQCLEAVGRQTYPQAQIEIHILDNGSTDKTIPIIEELLSGFVNARFTKGTHNLGMWPGQEKLLENTQSPYVVFLSADVIMAPDFLAGAVTEMDADKDLGGIQAKIYQFAAGKELNREMIDTCGFQVDRSRRIQNIGHGEPDRGQYDSSRNILGVEGAVPIFRKAALESIRVMGEIADHDLFWYGEDLDVAWRLLLAGWKQRYIPSVVAWHDRGTTKGHTRGSWFAYIKKVSVRRQISMHKRRLEWRNTRWTRIKNDYMINVFRDLPYILMREAEVLGYALLFEPGVLKEVPAFLRGIPRMLRKRHAILARAKVSPERVRSYFT